MRSTVGMAEMTKLIQVSSDAIIIFADMTDKAFEEIKGHWKHDLKLMSNREPSTIIATEIEVIE